MQPADPGRAAKRRAHLSASQSRSAVSHEVHNTWFEESANLTSEMLSLGTKSSGYPLSSDIVDSDGMGVPRKCRFESRVDNFNCRLRQC